MISELIKNTREFCSTPEIIYATITNKKDGSIMYISFIARCKFSSSRPGRRIFTMGKAKTYISTVAINPIIVVLVIK